MFDSVDKIRGSWFYSEVNYFFNKEAKIKDQFRAKVRNLTAIAWCICPSTFTADLFPFSDDRNDSNNIFLPVNSWFVEAIQRHCQGTTRHTRKRFDSFCVSAKMRVSVVAVSMSAVCATPRTNRARWVRLWLATLPIPHIEYNLQSLNNGG